MTTLWSSLIGRIHGFRNWGGKSRNDSLGELLLFISTTWGSVSLKILVPRGKILPQCSTVTLNCDCLPPGHFGFLIPRDQQSRKELHTVKSYWPSYWEDVRLLIHKDNREENVGLLGDPLDHWDTWPSLNGKYVSATAIARDWHGNQELRVLRDEDLCHPTRYAI